MSDATHLLDLVQLTDSAFPSGSYAYSGGLEGLYALGEVDLEQQSRWLLANGLARVELPVLRMAYCGDDLESLDRLMDVLLPVRELRDASRSIGRSFLRAAARLKPYHPHVEHHAVAFGAILREWRVDLEVGSTLYAFHALRQQLSAAQRLGKLGQSAMQDLLHRLKPAIRSAVNDAAGVSRDQLGGFSPWLDLACMAHEHQSVRLFRS